MSKSTTIPKIKFHAGWIYRTWGLLHCHADDDQNLRWELSGASD